MIITFKCDYADEFDVWGFRRITKEDWQKCLETSKAKFDRDGKLEYGFGTNEVIEWTSYSEFLDSFVILSATPEEESAISRIFRFEKTGIFPDSIFWE
jgi:hypothetical protein